MSLAFADRYPNKREIERLRLILSTYQDGSGMLKTKEGGSLPGWRDFERAVAAGFGGATLENKAIYDVHLPIPKKTNRFYGISCKMRGTLRKVDNDGHVTIELSNAAGGFWDLLESKAITKDNYHEYADVVGKSLIEEVGNWHSQVDILKGGIVDGSKSCFLSLQWNPKTGDYQLYQFSISLPKPQEITWRVEGRHLKGILNNSVIMEWYPNSGGQLKYYPHYTSAVWTSKRFRLEPIRISIKNLILDKVAAYFPEHWASIN